jgi:hypothetical protein
LLAANGLYVLAQEAQLSFGWASGPSTSTGTQIQG